MRTRQARACARRQTHGVRRSKTTCVDAVELCRLLQCCLSSCRQPRLVGCPAGRCAVRIWRNVLQLLRMEAESTR